MESFSSHPLTGSITCLYCRGSVQFSRAEGGQQHYMLHLQHHHGVFFHSALLLSLNTVSLAALQRIVREVELEFRQTGQKSEFVGEEAGREEEVIELLEEVAEPAEPAKSDEHTCSTCDKKFPRIKELLIHVNMHTDEENIKKKRMADELKQRKEAKRRKTEANIIQVEVRSETENITETSIHQFTKLEEEESNTSPKPKIPGKIELKCKECDFVAYQNLKLKKHYKIAHKKQNKEEENKLNTEEHEQNEHKKQVKTEEENKLNTEEKHNSKESKEEKRQIELMIVTPLKQPKVAPSAKNNGPKKGYFECDKCDYRGVTAIRLKMHMMEHGSEAKFPCKAFDCKSKFSTEAKLNVHIGESHSGDPLQIKDDFLPANNTIPLFQSPAKPEPKPSPAKPEPETEPKLKPSPTNSEATPIESTKTREEVLQCKYFQNFSNQAKKIGPEERVRFPDSDAKLPAGWRMRELHRPNGRTDKEFLAPEPHHVSFRSRRAAVEYMRALGCYTSKQMETAERSLSRSC